MPRLLPCADSAILVSFSRDDDPLWRVAELDARLTAFPLSGVSELVPGLDSLLAVLDGEVPVNTVRAALDAVVESVMSGTAPAPPRQPRESVDLEVHFDAEHGPDLAAIAERAGTDAQGVVDMLTAAPLRVAMIGHLPGLPYLTGLPACLDLPRREAPRTAVPAGSVGIAAGMACVYPVRAPGGWHIVGWTPARLVDPERDPPFLLERGDEVRLVVAGCEGGRPSTGVDVG